MTSTQKPLVFITGANQGIGRATAQILAEKHSYKILIGSRNLETGEKAASELRDAGHEASAIQLDLTVPSSIQDAIAKIERDYGYLDVLINNAGILLDGGKRPESTWDFWTQTMTTNVIGTAVLTEGLAPLLRKFKCGPPRIVFVSTIMGSLEKSLDKTTQWYQIDYTAYDTSKAAMNMLAINYSRIMDDCGCKVNVVCPGLVKTNLTGYMEHASSPEDGAATSVAMAIIGEDGPTGTFRNPWGPVPW